MSKSVENRLATMEADMRNYEKTQTAIFSYMKEGREQREKMIDGFARLEQQSKQTLQYQKTCDTERKDLANRTTSLETSRTKQLGIAVGASTVITVIGGGIGWIVVNFKQLFS